MLVQEKERGRGDNKIDIGKARQTASLGTICRGLRLLKQYKATLVKKVYKNICISQNVLLL